MADGDDDFDLMIFFLGGGGFSFFSFWQQIFFATNTFLCEQIGFSIDGGEIILRRPTLFLFWPFLFLEDRLIYFWTYSSHKFAYPYPSDVTT